MKTTIELSDSLLLRAKRVARSRRQTLRSLTEQGLLTVLEQLEAEEKVQVQPVTFGGKGLQKEFVGKSWSRLRDAVYEGHGA